MRGVFKVSKLKTRYLILYSRAVVFIYSLVRT